MKIKEYIIKVIKEELGNLTSDGVITDAYIDELLSSDDVEYMFDVYKYDGNIDIEVDYDEFMEDKENEKDFENWLKYEMEYRFNEKKDLFNKLFFGGRIIIYRAMKVNKSWIQKLSKSNTKLGIYWAFKKNSAEPHWGYHKGTTEDVLIQASVTKDQVDWEGTYYANLSPSTGEEEKEIRLKENQKIQIEALWINNNEVKLNKTIKSNIYLS
jgi:hypothetical protein